MPGCFSEAFVRGRDTGGFAAGFALVPVAVGWAAFAGMPGLTVRICGVFMLAVPGAGTMVPLAVRVVTALAVGFTDVVPAGVAMGLAVLVVAMQGVVAAVFWDADFFLNSAPKLEIAEAALEIALLAF